MTTVPSIDNSLHPEQDDQAHQYPETRFMGSKKRLLPAIEELTQLVDPGTVMDPFAGSGCVSYMFKASGRRVIAGDLLKFSFHWVNATVANSGSTLAPHEVERLIAPNPKATDFIQRTFRDLYFTREDNRFLDNVSANISRMRNPFKQSIALSALTHACLRKRPRGVFTYVGFRYDDGRSHLRTSIQDLFVEGVKSWNKAVFDNGYECEAHHSDAYEIPMRQVDLAYIDPPYFSLRSDNDYTRRYHFLEGLVSYWRGLEIQNHTKTKKIVRRETPFQHRRTIYSAFDRLFERYKKIPLLVSYSSNCLPTKDEMIQLLKHHKSSVEVVDVDHTYSFGTHKHKIGNDNNRVKEYLFLAR